MKKKLLIAAAAVVFFAISGIGLYSQYSVPVLMYHSFDKTRLGVYSVVTPERFREQLKFIKSRGYRTISLTEYAGLLEKGRPLDRNLVVITIDDGYKDNLAAVKLLQEYDLPATIFMIADKTGEQGFLTEDDLVWIASQTPVSIGSHTCTHSYIPEINDQQLHHEIFDSRTKLENICAGEIDTFSFPIGGFDERTEKELKAAGYRCACATNRGFSRALSLYALRRIKVTQRDTGIRLWAKLSGYYNLFKKVKKPY